MAIAYSTLLDRLLQMEGSYDIATVQAATGGERKIQQRVSHINAALRWAWRTEDPEFMFPFTVGSGTVTVTAGVIDPADLGDGTCCSLWREDPRPATSPKNEVKAMVAEDGVYPTCSLSTVFAFYRNAAPQGTYVSGGNYASPSDIPDALEDIVALKALYTLMVSLKEWDSVNALKASYDDPGDIRDRLAAGLNSSFMPWRQNTLVLSSSTSGTAAISGIVAITNNYIAVRCPDGVTRYWGLNNQIP